MDEFKMLKKIVLFLFLGIILSGCRVLNRNVTSTPSGTPPVYTFETATDLPTQTPVPTSTITPSPTPDLGAVGLPTEGPGTTALDFVMTMCSAQWFNRTQQLPCPGDENNPNAGYVASIGGNALETLLTYPPQDSFETIFSKYPPFIVEKGDRFRTVLECKAHTFCDVVFSLEYYVDQAKTGVTNWPYIFSASPIVIDYPLDGIAGKKVQFGLSVRGNGNRLEAYAAWVYPHIYRPTP
jgi:hypothetical protein